MQNFQAPGLDQKPLPLEPKSSFSQTRQPLAQQTNGISKMNSSENDYLAPARINQLSRKHSDISNNSSEPDSLLELYKSQARNRSVPSGIETGGKRKIAGMGVNPEEDESNWIHRDKLAQIESRELEEAGFRVTPMSRSTSRSASNSVDKQEYGFERHGSNGQADAVPYAKRDEKRQRIVSPIPAEDEEAIIDYDYRMPEEVVPEREQKVITKAPPRLTGSRLPVAKRTGAPPTPNVAEHSPLPRSRTGSATQNNAPEGRPRSRSVGSQNYREQNGDRPQTPVRGSTSTNSDAQSKGSPPAAKSTSKTPASRKTSTNRNVSSTKSRQTSQTKPNDSPPKRPGTSSGIPRPSTSHRPEGDPPWIASMYKPDPRLPPDQQMLPTHAKRLAQEQWEREGKTGSVYDTQFRLLNTTELSPPEPRSPTKSTSSANGDAENEKPAQLTVNPPWPLNPTTPPLGSPRSISSSQRPGTSGTEHGGYSTMPKIQSPPPQRGSTQISSQRPAQQIRLQEPDEEDKEKKGLCGCCVVM